MKNPIPTSGMFATPNSMQDLYAQVEQMTGGERQAALIIMMMTMNLCSQMVDRELAKEAYYGA